MTPSITNLNCAAISNSAEARHASTISPSASPEREAARKPQRNGQRRESFLSALLRALSTVAF
jgi:hypothetical protein